MLQESINFTPTISGWVAWGRVFKKGFDTLASIGLGRSDQADRATFDPTRGVEVWDRAVACAYDCTFGVWNYAPLVVEGYIGQRCAGVADGPVDCLNFVGDMSPGSANVAVTVGLHDFGAQRRDGFGAVYGDGGLVEM